MSTPGFWDLNPKIREYAIALNEERMPLREIRERIRVRFGDAKIPHVNHISRLRMALGKGRYSRKSNGNSGNGGGNGEPDFPAVMDRRYWTENTDLRKFALPLLRSHTDQEVCSTIRIVFGAERVPTARQVRRLRQFVAAEVFALPAPTITTEIWPEDHRGELALRPVRQGEIVLKERRYWADRLEPFVGQRLFIGEHPKLRGRFFTVQPASFEILCEVFPVASDRALEQQDGAGVPYELRPHKRVQGKDRVSPELSAGVRALLTNRHIHCRLPGLGRIPSATCLGRQIKWKRQLHEHNGGEPHANPRYSHCREGPCPHYLPESDYRKLRGLMRKGFRIRPIA